MKFSQQKKFALINQLNTFHRTRSIIVYLLIFSILLPSCNCYSGIPNAKKRGENIVQLLENIEDPRQRESTAVYIFNTMHSLSRLASGIAEGPVEEKLKDHFSNLDDDSKSIIKSFGETLDAIPVEKKEELLGRFSDYNPRTNSSYPDWYRISRNVIFSHVGIPRLRTNFCSGNLTYADSTSADRSITVGATVIGHSVGDIDSGDGAGDIVASGASPVILGVEGEFVSARHPSLASTNNEEGMSPFGVVTNIPCNSFTLCDQSKGMICGTIFGAVPKCISFPVVQKDHNLILRGYNFWDINESKLVLTPLISGEGSQSISNIIEVNPNEPILANEACPIPSISNATHNRAHFNITANKNNFYKLKMYNHNGNFFTQNDVNTDADPRVIHVAYPESMGDIIGIPLGTIRDCTLPSEPCVQDGALCSVTWGTSPRQLSECSHPLGTEPVCGETPEWFSSEKLNVREDGIGLFNMEPIIYVSNDEPVYQFKATLQAVECLEETGWDRLGSDEPMLLIAGFKTDLDPGVDADLLDKMDKAINTWTGNDYDSGERKTEIELMSIVDDLNFDDEVVYLLMMAEDDGSLGGFLVGAAVIVAAAVIIYLSGGAALYTVIGSAFLLGVWAKIYSDHSEDDPLGTASFFAKSLHFDERINASHASDFLNSPPIFGALPTKAGGPSLGEKEARIIHPFYEYSASEEPLESECNPGGCPTGKTCNINRCEDRDFIDPTMGVAFKERREFKHNGGHYLVDILWELKKVNP